ncbi:hypothetical protein [Desulfosporosinus sp. BG]|uniref:hypothetical protein n=1 Tax=Desulfosporosinus sp. BG TaxID=1633135 RepID=UPI000857B91D|nr:hypothetical protein [Desulfosporosinus sp. BG]ODA38727.1 hypothetical protein DSBG_4498 [Desulfosporosinus sp. BG]
MITADITGTIDPITGNAILSISFQGFELFLGAILGGIAAVVIWITLKNFAK